MSGERVYVVAGSAAAACGLVLVMSSWQRRCVYRQGSIHALYSYCMVAAACRLACVDDVELAAQLGDGSLLPLLGFWLQIGIGKGAKGLLVAGLVIPVSGGQVGEVIWDHQLHLTNALYRIRLADASRGVQGFDRSRIISRGKLSWIDCTGSHQQEGESDCLRAVRMTAEAYCPGFIMNSTTKAKRGHHMLGATSPCRSHSAAQHLATCNQEGAHSHMLTHRQTPVLSCVSHAPCT